MSGKLGIKIESDFEDYYDNLSVSSGYLGVYKRFFSDIPRGKLLNVIREQGVNTIKLQSARTFSGDVDKLVVYTNTRLHESKGKLVLDLNDAKMMYGNQLAAKFYSESNGETIKVLQIGSRRFRVLMKTHKEYSLDGGDVQSIDEIASELNYGIAEPIFSIDYISNGKEMLAVDFNPVQRLDKLGIESILSSGEVIYEIQKALVAYNKI